MAYKLVKRYYIYELVEQKRSEEITLMVPTEPDYGGRSAMFSRYGYDSEEEAIEALKNKQENDGYFSGKYTIIPLWETQYEN